MGVSLPFRFGAYVGALMATKRTRRLEVLPASDVPLGEPAEVSGRSPAELVDSARRSMMEAVPDAATALAKQATEGSVPHIKLMMQLVGLDEAGFAPVADQRHEKTLEEILMEKWDQVP